MSLRPSPFSGNLFSPQKPQTHLTCKSATTHFMLWQFAGRSGTSQGLVTSSLFFLTAALSPSRCRSVAFLLRALSLLGLRHGAVVRPLARAQTISSIKALCTRPLLRPLRAINRIVHGNLLARRASLLGFHTQLSAQSNRRPLGQVGGVVACPGLPLTHSVAKLWNLFFFFPNVLSGVRLNPKTVYPTATNILPHAALFMPRISVVAFVRARSYRARQRADAIVGDVFVRFLEALSGGRAWLHVDRCPQHTFTPADIGYVALLAGRISRQVQAVSALRQWRYLSMCLFLMFRYKDPQFLMTWLHVRLSTMSAFRHKRFLSTVTFLIKAALAEIGAECGMAGCRLDVVGKISVTGNARSRSLIFKRGYTGITNSKIKAASEFYLVRTATGCLGLTLWVFYF